MSLREIAKSLDLSITTVSRALGNFSDVSQETKERVRAEAERIGYIPNQFARRLQKGKADAIGFVLPGGAAEFEDPAFAQIIAAIGSRLADTDYDFLLMAAEPGEPEARVYRRLIDGKRVDGLFLVRARADDPRPGLLAARGIPGVWLGQPMDPQGCGWLDVDHASAFRRACERLIAFGHARIAFLAPPVDMVFFETRGAGYREAITRAGLEPTIAPVAALTEAAGYEAARVLLAAPEPPTALMCATDTVALGAYRAARGAGLRVGTDLSIIGYGDYPGGRSMNPGLTTLRYPGREMVRRGIDLLIDMIEAGSPAIQGEFWRAELLVRGSDGPAP